MPKASPEPEVFRASMDGLKELTSVNKTGLETAKVEHYWVIGTVSY
jgi:hypothetical protein